MESEVIYKIIVYVKKPQRHCDTTYHTMNSQIIAGVKICSIPSRTTSRNRYFLYSCSKEEVKCDFCDKTGNEFSVYIEDEDPDISYLTSNGVVESIKMCQFHAYNFFNLPIMNTIFNYSNDTRNKQRNTNPAIIKTKSGSIYYYQKDLPTPVHISNEDIVIGWEFLLSMSDTWNATNTHSIEISHISSIKHVDPCK